MSENTDNSRTKGQMEPAISSDYPSKSLSCLAFQNHHRFAQFACRWRFWVSLGVGDSPGTLANKLKSHEISKNRAQAVAGSVGLYSRPKLAQTRPKHGQGAAVLLLAALLSGCTGWLEKYQAGPVQVWFGDQKTVRSECEKIGAVSDYTAILAYRPGACSKLNGSLLILPMDERIIAHEICHVVTKQDVGCAVRKIGGEK